MIGIIFTNIYVFILASLLAILEIQIEGAQGWAMNLPAWRPSRDKWYVKAYEKFMSGREFTGYHLIMFTFVLFIFHLPYVFGLSFSLEHWLKTISFFLIFTILWDFLWFVFNPHYPLKRFTGQHIWWHKKWLGGLPADYYGGLILSGLIFLPISLSRGSWEFFGWWLVNICLFIILTLLAILFTFWVLDIDNWQEKK